MVAVGLLCAVSIGAGDLAAQGLRGLPGFADPGRLDKQFQDGDQPLSRPDPIVPDSRRRLPAAVSSNIKFTLTAFEFEGNTVFEDEEFLPLYEEFLDQETNLTEIYKIANKVTTKYRKAGYITTQLLVPAQRIRDGKVKLRVVEGYIARIEVEGDELPEDGLIQALLQPILDARPLDGDTLERSLLLINDLPGVRAKAIMLPSEDKDGASELLLQIARNDWRARLSLDNRGTDFLGPNQALGSVSWNSTFTEFDSLMTRFVMTPQARELKYGLVNYQVPIGLEGVKLGFNASFSRSQPGEELSSFDLKSRNRTFGVTVDYPMIRSRRSNLILKGQMEYRDSASFLGPFKTTDDRSRVVRAGAAFDFADDTGGVTLLSGMVSQGLDVLNANDSDSLLSSRKSARPDFTHFGMTATHLRQPLQNWRAIVSVTGQYSLAKLLSSEQFGYGGAGFGRAYDSSELTGDHGLAGKIELQYTTDISNDYILGLQPFTSYDVGSVWNIDDKLNDERISGSSISVGMNMFLIGNLSGYVEVAKPITRGVASKSLSRDPRFFFSLGRGF